MSAGKPGVNYWALSSERLAVNCGEISASDATEIPPEMRAEATRLFTAWQEALALPSAGFGHAERRATLLAGLRRRTIEILLEIDRLK